MRKRSDTRRKVKARNCRANKNVGSSTANRRACDRRELTILIAATGFDLSTRGFSFFFFFFLFALLRAYLFTATVDNYRSGRTEQQFNERFVTRRALRPFPFPSLSPAPINNRLEILLANFFSNVARSPTREKYAGHRYPRDSRDFNDTERVSRTRREFVEEYLCARCDI